MISALHIKNIGIIDEINLNLGYGLNILTGETGSGKTLIIDAINILLGGRFSKEMIRKGETYSFVEMSLFLTKSIKRNEKNVVVSREIHLNGRNICKINGRLVTLAELKEFMSNIIDIHGQHDNQKILEHKYHIDYLDNFINDNILDMKEEYKRLYQERLNILRKLKENLGDDKEKQRMLDLLNYQYKEIECADLKEGEEELLNEKRNIFLNSEKIVKSLSSANISLGDNAIDYVSSAIKDIEKISDIDEEYNNILANLKNIYYEIQEASRDISLLDKDIYFDENERCNIEERLDLIYSLKRKYGNDIKEILEYKEKIYKDIQRIENLDKYNEKLKDKLINIEKEMNDISKRMHEKRLEFSKVLDERINKELIDLDMKNAKFLTKITTSEFNNNGKDIVEFMISTNIGEEEKSLVKIASGGEMSRIMLAIKTVLAKTDNMEVLIFDEIDTGISGKAAKKVGEKLKIIGKSYQVLCITHQASIAAKGDENYYISKVSENNRTFTKIKKLNENEIIEEIARISNGEITEIAKKHAIELRKTA